MDQSNPNNYLKSEQEYFELLETYFQDSSGSFNEKMYAFSRFVPRQALSYFLARHTVFEKIVSLHGSIVDFGIYRGASFFTWQQLSALFEPYNHIRKIIGFESFEGFSDLGPEDSGADNKNLILKTKGGMAYEGEEEITQGIELLNKNRPLGHVEKGILVQGKLPDAFADYLAKHPELIVSLANFGLGLYEPTLELLKLLKPRLVKGSIVVFEDLNQATWPGETTAFFEIFGGQYSLQRSPLCPHLSWVELS